MSEDTKPARFEFVLGEGSSLSSKVLGWGLSAFILAWLGLELFEKVQALG